METRANYALIGLFTLAVIAAAFGFVYWFSGGERGQARQNIRIVFSGSVSGLSQGSSVSFNGLRVGEVTSLDLLPEDPRRVVAIATVNSNTPIRSDTRARLEYQGLTGVANVGLSGGEAGAPPLVAGPGQPMPTIFADRSDFQDLIETARNIARRADDVLERVGRVIADNEGSINRTVQNVERFSQALGENAEGIDRFLAQVGQAAEKVGPLAEKLETLATNVDEVVRSVDRQRVARIVENVDNFTTALGENRQVVSDALKDAASLIGRLNETAPKLDSAVAEIAAVTKAIDPAKIGRTVDNVDTFTQTLSRRSPDIDKAIQEARSITEKLNKSADKIDSVLAGAEKFLGSASGESGKGAFDEIRAAAVAVRELATDLNTRTEGIQGILGGVNRFTESGLREYEALAVEGRKTLGDISRAVRSIERNPQQFIFGGSPNLPQYNGRR
ncbi:MlaD family protein [Microvirga mediterraneensis]|uniref:MCE family protein n=1 Tax=Microvirga mediterraneensis TaxID=2754695 RepID=A0A838BLW5_9HYPH|nr:MlaD family protein [Microvirga mediterraneensis]MBA1156537.1 MCE family protein [Microvirga mediterraneensis]